LPNSSIARASISSKVIGCSLMANAEAEEKDPRASTRPDKLKVLVCGARDFDDRAAVYAKLDRLHADRPFRAVIAGGAHGADTLAIEWANQGSRCPF
jgi:hypothetical protein